MPLSKETETEIWFMYQTHCFVQSETYPADRVVSF